MTIRLVAVSCRVVLDSLQIRHLGKTSQVFKTCEV